MATILRLTRGNQATVWQYFHDYHGRNFGLMILRDHNHRRIVCLRMQQAGVIPSDYATIDGGDAGRQRFSQAGEVYAALDMPFAVLVGQMAEARSTD